MTTPPGHDARMQRLEEHAAFMEHSMENLSVEVAAINKRLQSLSRRLDLFEKRVNSLCGSSDDEHVAPPTEIEGRPSCETG